MLQPQRPVRMDSGRFEDLPRIARRFLAYAEMDTASDPSSGASPSTRRQLAFAQILAIELREAGAEDVRVSNAGVVTATIPASPGAEDRPVMGLLAHMDTSPEAPSDRILPRVADFTGEPLRLDEAGERVLSIETHPELARHRGERLIVTDGRTLLGADDKAGVAVLVELAAHLADRPGTPHAKIRLAFTPDEEIGRGTDHLPLEEFGADYAYTFDGGEVGELETENFHAAEARIVFRGVNTHPGAAKGRMKNALRMAGDFIGSLPKKESPEETEGRDGFYHPTRIEGSVAEARLELIIRDFDRPSFEARKRAVMALAEALNEVHGEGSVTADVRDQYANMKEGLEAFGPVVELAREALRRAGLELREPPVRGGTDGAMLTAKGLPTPNLFAGGLYFHSVFECLPIPSLEAAFAAALELARGSAELKAVRG